MSSPAPRRLGLATYLGYAAGDAGCNLAFSMFGMFLLLYYTDVAHLPAAAAGTLFLVVRAWDAFADVAAGRLVASPRRVGASSGLSCSSAPCRCCF